MVLLIANKLLEAATRATSQEGHRGSDSLAKLSSAKMNGQVPEQESRGSSGTASSEALGFRGRFCERTLGLEDGGGLHQNSVVRGRHVNQKRPHQHLEAWRDLADALRREWRIVTRRRELTPKMVLTAIVAAGWGGAWPI
jgi:hypothetical protein